VACFLTPGRARARQQGTCLPQLPQERWVPPAQALGPTCPWLPQETSCPQIWKRQSTKPSAAPWRALSTCRTRPWTERWQLPTWHQSRGLSDSGGIRETGASQGPALFDVSAL